MCGRFTRHYTWEDLFRLYRLTSTPANIQPSYNVCPTDTVDTVIARDALPSTKPPVLPPTCPPRIACADHSPRQAGARL